MVDVSFIVRDVCPNNVNTSKPGWFVGHSYDVLSWWVLLSETDTEVCILCTDQLKK